MQWQEYQEAAARLYDLVDGIGRVQRNVYLPDRVTGQRRQIDILVELETKGHAIRIVVDAKFRAARLDVKDVEEVMALAEAVGANKAAIVASNGWSRPAAIRAAFSGLDLRLLTLEDAAALIRSELNQSELARPASNNIGQ
jgi:hypothetical protein